MRQISVQRLLLPRRWASFLEWGVATRLRESTFESNRMEIGSMVGGWLREDADGIDFPARALG
jgi:hypothetical protein